MSRPDLLSLEEAQARLLAFASPLALESLRVEEAVGRYLAKSLNARRTQPAADLSAMDGYAVDERDMVGPWRMVGESAAGHPYSGRIRPGEAVRIATGAILPEGAGAVILQEDIARKGARLILSGTPPHPAGKHIRRRGMDFTEGSPVLGKGCAIGPAQAALALSSGHAAVPVRRRPKVAIIESGDELSADPENCPLHQIPASNGVMLASLARCLPCDVVRPEPAGDSMEALARALENAGAADVIVTSGGASVGDHDLVRPALGAWGAAIDFWRIAIKPGKPLLVATREGRAGRQIILGLPGNPVSTFVTAWLFLLPVLRALLGASAPLPRSFCVRLGEALPPNGSRRTFLRAVWDGDTVTPQTVQDSGALAALAASNALIDRPAGAPPAQPGDMVRVYLLELRGGA